jgi:hypothetical protein
MLPVLLENLNRLLAVSHKTVMRELFVELCLTVPVRLSALLPHLHYLMRPLVLALQVHDLGLRGGCPHAQEGASLCLHVCLSVDYVVCVCVCVCACVWDRMGRVGRRGRTWSARACARSSCASTISPRSSSTPSWHRLLATLCRRSGRCDEGLHILMQEA